MTEVYQDSRGQWHTIRGPGEELLIATNWTTLYRPKKHFYFSRCGGTCGIGYLLGYPFTNDTMIRAEIQETRGDKEAQRQQARRGGNVPKLPQR